MEYLFSYAFTYLDVDGKQAIGLGADVFASDNGAITVDDIYGEEGAIAQVRRAENFADNIDVVPLSWCKFDSAGDITDEIK